MMTVTMSVTALDRLKGERPEWAPWLGVIEEILREMGGRRWDATVPIGLDWAPEAPGGTATERLGAVPLLAGVALSVQAGSIRSLVKRLIRIAVIRGTPKMRTLEGVVDRELDALTVFTASLCQDGVRIKEIADRYGVDAEALQAVVALVPVPFLQACNRRWASSIPQGWMEGYCPICGSWPAFAEVRGIERSRHFRCGRCSAQWHARPLCCPYCAMRDHNELVSLVPAKNDSNATIDACTHCLGYVKTFTMLQGCPSDRVIVQDLASVALDVAALEQGYTRPSSSAYPLNFTVAEKGGMRRFFVWSA
jgi:FdhE protein